jgi:hypothetical protein
MTPSPRIPFTAAALAASALVAGGAGAASAHASDRFVAVTNGHQLVAFQSDRVPALSEARDIGGLPGGERLVALDALPGDREVLGLGVSGTIYAIDVARQQVVRTVAGFGAQLLPGTRTATLSVAPDGGSARVIANGRDKAVDLTSGAITADAPAAATAGPVALDRGADGVLRGVDATANAVVSLDAAGEHVLSAFPPPLKTDGPTAATTAADGSTWISTGLANHDQSRLLRYDPKTNQLRQASSFLFERLDAIAGVGTAPDDTRAPRVSVRIPRQSVRDALRHRGFLAIVKTDEPGQTVMSARLGKAYRGFGFATAERSGQLRVVANERQASIRRLAGKRLRLHIAIHDWAGNTKLVDRYFTLRR